MKDQWVREGTPYYARKWKWGARGAYQLERMRSLQPGLERLRGPVAWNSHDTAAAGGLPAALLPMSSSLRSRSQGQVDWRGSRRAASPVGHGHGNCSRSEGEGKGEAGTHPAGPLCSLPDSERVRIKPRPQRPNPGLEATPVRSPWRWKGSPSHMLSDSGF